jgi:hypothetical protein
MKSSGRVVLRKTPLVQPVANEGNTEIRAMRIKMQHTEVTVIHIKLAVKQKAVKNTEIAVPNASYSVKSGP